MIDWHLCAVFLFAVAIGAWFQALSGFALGLVVMAIVQAFRAMPIAETAAVISVLAFLNVAAALLTTYKQVDKKLFLCLSLGQLPAILLGLAILNYLDGRSAALLEVVFSVFLISGGYSLARNPRTKPVRSSNAATVVVGFTGGIFGGMFAASGPVVGWFAYQQPILIASIRASLLAMLGVTTVTRTAIVATDSVFNSTLLWLIVVAVPVVIAVTMLSKRFPPQVSDERFRQVVFTIICMMGIWIFFAGVFKLVANLVP